MNFVNLKRESLVVTYNNIVYSKELYVTASSVTGIANESYPQIGILQLLMQLEIL